LGEGITIIIITTIGIHQNMIVVPTVPLTHTNHYTYRIPIAVSNHRLRTNSMAVLQSI